MSAKNINISKSKIQANDYNNVLYYDKIMSVKMLFMRKEHTDYGI